MELLLLKYATADIGDNHAAGILVRPSICPPDCPLCQPVRRPVRHTDPSVGQFVRQYVHQSALPSAGSSFSLRVKSQYWAVEKFKDGYETEIRRLGFSLHHWSPFDGSVSPATETVISAVAGFFFRSRVARTQPHACTHT